MLFTAELQVSLSLYLSISLSLSLVLTRPLSSLVHTLPLSVCVVALTRTKVKSFLLYSLHKEQVTSFMREHLELLADLPPGALRARVWLCACVCGVVRSSLRRMDVIPFLLHIQRSLQQRMNGWGPSLLAASLLLPPSSKYLVFLLFEFHFFFPVLHVQLSLSLSFSLFSLSLFLSP